MPDSRRYEPQHFHLPAILWFLACFFASLVVFYVGLVYVQAWLMRSVRAKYPEPSPVTQVVTPPEPRLQPSLAHPTNDWQDSRTLRATQEQQLHSYGRLLNEPDFVHVPIDRAMTLLVEKSPATHPEARHVKRIPIILRHPPSPTITAPFASATSEAPRHSNRSRAEQHFTSANKPTLPSASAASSPPLAWSR